MWVLASSPGGGGGSFGDRPPWGLGGTVASSGGTVLRGAGGDLYSRTWCITRTSFQCLRLTAKTLLRRLRCQEDLRFKNFRPAFGGDHRGTLGGGGVPAKPPSPPFRPPPPPPLLIDRWRGGPFGALCPGGASCPLPLRRYWVDQGVLLVHCMIHMKGIPALEERCQGMHETLTRASGRAVWGYVPGVSSGDALRTALTPITRGAAPNAAFTYSNTDVCAVALALAQELNRSDLRIANFDFSSELIPRLQDRTVDFTVHQQVYAQTFYAMLFAVQGAVSGHFVRHRLVATGPVLVDGRQVCARDCTEKGHDK